MAALARLGRSAAHQTAQARLRATLEEVAAQRGMSAQTLLDYLVPDHGLDGAGRLSAAAEGLTGTIQLDDRRGAVLAGPDAERLAQVAEVAELLAEIRATVAMVRDGLDAQFASRREWHVEDFTDSYLRHPIVGSLACRLVWIFAVPEGETVTGFPDRDGATVRTTEGTSAIAPDSLVRLLHPVLADPVQLDRLRQLAQPVYLMASSSRSASCGGRPADRIGPSRMASCPAAGTRVTFCGPGSSSAWPGDAAGMAGSCALATTAAMRR